MSAGDGSAKVIIFALMANLGIALSKAAGAFITQSASMFAEAIHSLVDTSNQILLLIGRKLSKRAPTEAHPLGYGREAFFWSFIVAIMLFSLGGLVAIYEGVHKFSNSEEIRSPLIALAILGVSLVLEGFSFSACLKEVAHQQKGRSLWRWFHETTSSELLVVLTEDAAALVGLTIATGCLIVSWVTGDPRWDAIGSIWVGIVLVAVAGLLAVEIKSLIVGEAPTTDFKAFIQEQIQTHIPGGRLLKLIAIQTGADEVLLSYKVHPGTIQSAAHLVDGINSLEKSVKKAFPEVRWQFVEPDWIE